LTARRGYTTASDGANMKHFAWVVPAPHQLKCDERLVQIDRKSWMPTCRTDRWCSRHHAHSKAPHIRSIGRNMHCNLRIGSKVTLSSLCRADDPRHKWAPRIQPPLTRTIYARFRTRTGVQGPTHKAVRCGHGGRSTRVNRRRAKESSGCGAGRLPFREACARSGRAGLGREKMWERGGRAGQGCWRSYTLS
jgi:hypothetical protein